MPKKPTFYKKLINILYLGEREIERDLRPGSRTRSPISMDLFLCNDEVVIDKLRLCPPWLDILFLLSDIRRESSNVRGNANYVKSI